MTIRIRTLIRWSIAAALAGGWLAVGCASPSDDSGNSNTNWLRSCDTDGDCNGLSCLCGVCTRSCATETCRGLDVLATCVVPMTSVANTQCDSHVPAGGVCTKPCTGDGDCTTLSSSLRCLGGACLGGAPSGVLEAGVRNGTGGATGRDSSTNESGGSNTGGSSGSATGGVILRDGGNGGASFRDSSGNGGSSGTGPYDAPYDSALPNCQSGGAGRSDCGPNHESCCASPLLTGGSFFRSYDAVTFLDKGHPATVSDFRLDRYEVTVGRFRDFVNAVVDGWRPTASSGTHAHLNGGRGLVDSSASGTFESGWNTSWNNHLSATKPGWDAQLTGSPQSGIVGWTSSPDANEGLPITRVDWYQAYAFCIWDGGFLPSESEWNYAASGGSEERVYPWSSPPTSLLFDCAHANSVYFRTQRQADGGGVEPFSCSQGSTDVGAKSPAGDGKWGQADLAGNVSEWTLDWFTSYVAPCNNCAFLSTTSEPVTERVRRGGSSLSNPTAAYPGTTILVAERASAQPASIVDGIGFRCARSP